MRELTDLELDILKILADNKGHALWELAERLGKEKSNLILTLNRLEDEIELTNSYNFGYYDLMDTEYLWLKFLKPNDLLTQYIRKRFRPEIIPIMDKDYCNFNMYINSELDRLLDDPNLFEEKRFAHIVLSKKITELIIKRPNGQELRYLNRLLLEEAYPEGIAKCQASLIYKGASRRTTNPESKQPRHHEVPYFINTNLLVLKFIIINIKRSNKKIFKKNYRIKRDQLEDLKEKVEWYLISDDEFRELSEKIELEMLGDADWTKYDKKNNFLNEFISSPYILQFAKNYGFKWTIHHLHGLVGGWDSCWALGKNAIDSGVIKDEADLECAEKLLRWHQSVEEGLRRLEEKDEEDDRDI